MKRIVFILMVSVITFGTMAQGPDGRRNDREHSRGRAHGPQKALAMLDLTDAQEEQMKNMRIEHQKSIKGDQQSLKLKMVELSNLVSNDNPDPKQVDRLTDEIGNLQTALFKAQIGHRMEVRTILNEEQKLKFDQMKLHHGPGKRGRR